MESRIITKEMSDIIGPQYLDYAVSVITDRALPDVRDGLKPVHRRILYSTNRLGLYPNKPHKKSARIVGECLGVLHPHGDASVYEAMIKMSQDFYCRYPLIDVHGNNGSLDGDPAAAMRYTEAKMSNIGLALLKDLNKDTVDFIPNYDGEEIEPTVLPGLFPNLLVNGTQGIAVGMSSSIPTHNICDIYNALYYCIDSELEEKEPDINEIIKIIKAPDFPTGGVIVNKSSIKDFYLTGRGKVTVRSKYDIETSKKNNSSIVITEIPYRVNKQKLVENMLQKAKDKTIDGIKDIRDESSKDGIRIVIELKKDVSPSLVVNTLCKTTAFQTSISVINLVLHKNNPTIMNIKEMLEAFLYHCIDVLVRKLNYDLRVKEHRLSLCQALNWATREDIIDILIKTIKESDDVIQAIKTLNKDLSDEQIKYIADTKIRSLSKTNITELSKEIEMLNNDIEKIQSILNDPIELLTLLKSEYKTIEDKFKDSRRTEISNEDSQIDDLDLVKDENLIVTISSDGLIKSVEESEYKSQKRGGKGVKGTNNKEDEITKYMLTVNAKDNLLFFSDLGRCHSLRAYKIDKSSKNSRGRAIFNYLTLEQDEKIISILSTNDEDKDKSLFFATKNGIVKKMNISELSSVRSVTKVITFKEGDLLSSVIIVNEGQDVMLFSSQGKSIRFNSDIVRPMGRTAAGVKGMNIQDNDILVDAISINDNEQLFLVTQNAMGKKITYDNFNPKGRGGKGMIGYKVTNKTGPVINAIAIDENSEIFLATQSGQIMRVKINTLRDLSRTSIGVKMMNLNKDDYIIAASKISIDRDDEVDE